jgi:peptide/nickel transport system substrate-binding protein
MVFFNTTSGLLQDKPLRQALAMAVDRNQVVKSLAEQAIPVNTPILPGQAGYSSILGQTENLDSAKTTLDNDGWVVGSGGIRHKNGKPLTFTMVTQAQSNYATTARDLQRQWRKIGVNLRIQAVDLTTLQQSFIRPRDFDALLYGIEIGSDPDVYAFWDSSQTKDPGLNLSAYSSSASDEALETGRVNANPEIRAGKYQVFETNWRDDAPGVAVSSPLYAYATLSDVWGVSSAEIVQPSDRFNNVTHWMINYRLVRRSSYAVRSR